MRSPSRFLFRTSIISDLYKWPSQFIKIDYVSLICWYHTHLSYESLSLKKLELDTNKEPKKINTWLIVNRLFKCKKDNLLHFIHSTNQLRRESLLNLIEKQLKKHSISNILALFWIVVCRGNNTFLKSQIPSQISVAYSTG